MPQLFSNVTTSTDTFGSWVTKTNQLIVHANKGGNTTGVANFTSANGTFTNVLTVSGPSTFTGNIVAANVEASTLKFTTLTVAGGNANFTSNVTLNTTGALKLPAGNTLQRNNHSSVGHIRYNTQVGGFEGYFGAGWQSLVSNTYLTATYATLGNYVSNTVFQSALANTNSWITTNRSTENSRLANTNSYIAANKTIEDARLANTNSAIADRMQVANVVSKIVALQIAFG